MCSRELFLGCSSLRSLSLSANFLRKWPSASLKPIAHHLHTLDMGENSLRELEPLAGFQQLDGLRLSGNRLRNLTAETFVHSLHIKMLNVADNLLEHIDQSTFEPLKHLKVQWNPDLRAPDLRDYPYLRDKSLLTNFHWSKLPLFKGFGLCPETPI